MAPQMDPMSAAAQDMMDEYNTQIVAHARKRIWEQKQALRILNDQRTEE